MIKNFLEEMIIDRSKDSNNNNIDFTAKDMGFLLLQSEVSYILKINWLKILQNKYF
ncbi:hypothetical protein [Clostridioides difficile]|uniref:hypothetical protein n=1 Tax=Clostridioides difficile TaxID=1496 RepID=UPI001F424016|nr:hypothetical protein [Clostridioides difficile]